MKMDINSLWRDRRYNCSSETDTIHNIIEPILQYFGWDIDNVNEVKKIKHQNQEDVDFRLLKEGKYCSAIECKTLHSNEFKICLGVGTINPMSLVNVDKDGVGQLRRYCFGYKNDKILAEPFFPIITNGLRWVVFDKEEFLESSLLSVPINTEKILFDEIIINDNFLLKIEKYLSKTF